MHPTIYLTHLSFDKDAILQNKGDKIEIMRTCDWRLVSEMVLLMNGAKARAGACVSYSEDSAD